MNFEWTQNQMPELEDHSKAKLEVLRSYLGRYYDRLGSVHARDVFRLDVVDGFAGGGMFSYQGKAVSGSPLIMLEELKAAEGRLSSGRRKELTFDVNHYFIDSNKQHICHLESVLREREYSFGDGCPVSVICDEFEHVLDRLISQISQRQPKAGRAIFVLDQCGYSQVHLNSIKKIFNRLSSAEVILTFAADSLINFIHDSPQFVRSVKPIGLTDEQLQCIKRRKQYEKPLAQRLLRDHIREECDALYDTPFFICPKDSRRALWFIHLSQHPTARDVMMQCHWHRGNTFLHHGTGGFDFMGWDSMLKNDSLGLFRFGNHEEIQLKNDLLNTLPDVLNSLVLEEPISIEQLRRRLANQTAATYSILDDVLVKLHCRDEFSILNSQGKERNKALIHLDKHDTIRRSSQLRLFINRGLHN